VQRSAIVRCADFLLAVDVVSILVVINLQVQLYCIVTGSCRPFASTSVRRYLYELERGRELLVICVYNVYTLYAIKTYHFICETLHVHVAT